MSTYLLDANVLIALSVTEHAHHDRAIKWLLSVDRVATCPIVEGSLVRYLVRIGESARTATGLVRALHDFPRFEFWPDSLSYVDAQLGEIRGHRQVTDAYLVSLAQAKAGLLATFDRGIATIFPHSCVLIASGE